MFSGMFRGPNLILFRHIFCSVLFVLPKCFEGSEEAFIRVVQVML